MFYVTLIEYMADITSCFTIYGNASLQETFVL